MPRDTLTRERIVAAAIELLDADGPDGLSMRTLGTRLNSAATAVYWHVGSKDNLMALAGDEVWHEVELPDPAAKGWREAAADMATSLYAMLTRHPWLVQIFGSYIIFGPGKARHDDHAISIYEAAGFTGDELDAAMTTVFTYVLGNALGHAAATSLPRNLGRDGADSQQRIDEAMARAVEIASQFPHLRSRLGTETADYAASPVHAFDYGLATILDGLEARLTRTGRKGAT
ncbi:MAG TPA: TetR/AcrR family transcriptional regulator C-terminal domain-containing protein [Micromonosporaceae bacterium]|jgi:AcrR family transcriptional regulator